MFGVGADLDGAAAGGVRHAEGEDGRAVVGSDFALGGVEAHALRDERGLGAVRAPYREGHLEAHCLLSAGEPWGALLVQFVAGRGPLDVGRHVPPHVEALHRDGGGGGPVNGLGWEVAFRWVVFVMLYQGSQTMLLCLGRTNSAGVWDEQGCGGLL